MKNKGKEATKVKVQMVFITIFCPKPFTTALLVFMKGLLDATLSLDLVRLGLSGALNPFAKEAK